MNASRVKPILRWPGGKSRLLKHILPLIGKDHTCFCEPFAGGLAVLLAKERSKLEVINDVNSDLIALYLNIQNHLPELLRQIDMLVTSRQLFHLFTGQPGLTDLQRAARFLFRNRISFGGNMHSFGVAKTAGGVGLNRKAVKHLVSEIHQRLNSVVIENVPYERCLDNYDSRDTLHFMDPPYLHSKIDAYAGFEEKDLRTFRKRVERLKGKWIVTLDDSPLNRELFDDCNMLKVVSRNRSVNVRTHGSALFGELIITPK